MVILYYLKSGTRHKSRRRRHRPRSKSTANEPHNAAFALYRQQFALLCGHFRAVASQIRQGGPGEPQNVPYALPHIKSKQLLFELRPDAVQRGWFAGV